MLKNIAKIIVLLILIFGIGFFFFVSSNKPTYSGSLEIKNLNDEVTVYFDEIGVPHIYAKDQNDAYTAMGYLHAQDRLWQMELMRRISAGRLSEIFGEDMVKTDKFFLGIGIQRAAEKTIRNLDTTTQASILTEAYLNGINQFIENGTTPIEFRLIGIEKEKYTIKDVYNVFGYMAFSFAQAHKTDPFLTELREKLGDAYVLELGIDISPNSTIIQNYNGNIKSNVASSISTSVNEVLKNVPMPLFIGSNSWVIGAKKTKNNGVIFANDPHIEFSQPSVWYQSHIVTPDYEMYGFNLALTPFPLLGHNRNYAYGLTMFENDDVDFYQENGSQQYQIRKETIQVKDEDPVIFEIKEGKNGPIMNDFLEDLHNENPIAMDWIYTKYGNQLLEVGYDISHSGSLIEFKKGAAKLHAPGLNIMYGDAQNNIAWFASAKLISRSDGLNPKFILREESAEQENFKMLAFDKNPQAINPSWNYVYSANNQPEAVDDILYPGYYLPEDRAKRIVHLLHPKNDFTREDVEAMLLDTESSVVPELIPIIIKELSKVNLSSNEKEAISILQNWKGDYSKTDTAPTIYNKFIYLLLKNTFSDEMGEEGFQQFLKTHLYLRQIAKQINTRKSIWWDDISTKNIKENRDEMITKAFHQAISSLENQFGEDMEKWHWEKAITVNHKHVFDKIAILKGFFNVGPFTTNGGNEVINNQIFPLNESGIYQVKAGPSTRRIIDFSAVENSVSILPTGQSGNVFSKHYKDQAEKYLDGKYVKMMLNKEEIKLSRDKLILKPVQTKMD